MMDDLIMRDENGKPLPKRRRKALRKNRLLEIKTAERKAVHEEIKIRKVFHTRLMLEEFCIFFLIPNILLFIFLYFAFWRDILAKEELTRELWRGNVPEEIMGSIVATIIFVSVFTLGFGGIILRDFKFPDNLFNYEEIDMEYAGKYPWYWDEIKDKYLKRVN